MYEVEQKHAVTDVHALMARLAERAISPQSAELQADCYFAHPARDFAATDEALRIRTIGDRSFVTYKGPKIDTTTKTRRELELPLDPADADGAKFVELLTLLGFCPVATVRKRRRKFHIEHRGRRVEGALDDVEGLGTFIELELVADESTLAEAQQCIRELAAELGLGPTERRGYLQMLLTKP